MSAKYQSYAAIAPSQTDNAYIFALVPTIENGLAAITSASELLLVNRENLSSSQVVRIQGAPSGTNCLALGDDQGSSVLCSGTDGTVTAFDLRSQNKAFEFKNDRAVTALAVNGASIAIGTEFKANQAIVSLWTWQNAENNDEITAIEFHPSRSNVVLAGGDDGLVSLFDTQVVEEEDSLLQVINHGPIHKAGFLGDDRIYALSSDQNLAVHPVSTPGDEEDPQPTLFGDLRSVIPCQYVVDVFKSGHDYVIAAGTNIEYVQSATLYRDPNV
ncbi:hypothetical protein LTR05_007288 [Lithohypha guttulata]|uniref:Uncharacterized protein n=1 Tax=Lithohypha guttulata TaxID=1690604 RepID=A0AAN7Y4J0_9EURO|nr:hypothetical protein LTR05_007288 [Lithohypha guttulata]